MEEIVSKLAGIGLPAVILLITMASTGLAGAAITAALAFLGPGGMIGGIIVLLGIIGLASDALTKYGLTELLKGIYKKDCPMVNLCLNFVAKLKVYQLVKN